MEIDVPPQVRGKKSVDQAERAVSSFIESATKVYRDGSDERSAKHTLAPKRT
jgi:hypothetical protein